MHVWKGIWKAEEGGERKNKRYDLWSDNTASRFFFPVPRKRSRDTILLLPPLLFQAWESDTALVEINHPLPLSVSGPKFQ